MNKSQKQREAEPRKIEVYTDGGSRGNPGPGGIGAAVKHNGETKKYSQYLGDRVTNNEAEYEALIFALKKIKQLLGKENAKKTQVKCYADSELLVRQLNHEYKLKNEEIQKKFINIWNLMLDFKKVEFFHIPREENKEADALANKAMDQAASKLFD
ncbi:MAG: ribonuclease HI family protein [Candidatus Moranbacteria bacterium]|nr:ribonuclease HI family protein [Candidatus Moranbacteria bacterium]